MMALDVSRVHHVHQIRLMPFIFSFGKILHPSCHEKPNFIPVFVFVTYANNIALRDIILPKIN